MNENKLDNDDFALRLPKRTICEFDPRLNSALSNRKFCCDKKWEHSMFNKSQELLEHYFRNKFQTVSDFFSQNSAVLQAFYRSNVDSTREHLHQLFSQTYGYQYKSNKQLFFNLFIDLQKYLDSNRSDIEVLLEAFFSQLRSRILSMTLSSRGGKEAEASPISISSKQIQCIENELKRQNAFGPHPDTIRSQIVQVYPISRAFVHTLTVVGDSLRNLMSKTPFYKECTALHMRIAHCPTCYSYGILPPCQDYCRAQFDKCLEPYKSIEDIWPQLIDKLKRTVNLMEYSNNLPTVNSQLPMQISDTVMALHNYLQQNKERLVGQCQNSDARVRRAANQQMGSRSIPANTDFYSSNWQKNFNPQSMFSNNNVNGINNDHLLENNNNFDWSHKSPTSAVSNSQSLTSADTSSDTGNVQEQTLVNFVTNFKNQLSQYENQFSNSMGICSDKIDGLGASELAPCWNGSAFGKPEFFPNSKLFQSLSDFSSVRIKKKPLKLAQKLIEKESGIFNETVSKLEEIVSSQEQAQQQQKKSSRPPVNQFSDKSSTSRQDNFPRKPALFPQPPIDPIPQNIPSNNNRNGFNNNNENKQQRKPEADDIQNNNNVDMNNWKETGSGETIDEIKSDPIGPIQLPKTPKTPKSGQSPDRGIKQHNQLNGQQVPPLPKNSWADNSANLPANPDFNGPDNNKKSPSKFQPNQPNDPYPGEASGQSPDDLGPQNSISEPPPKSQPNLPDDDEDFVGVGRTQFPPNNMDKSKPDSEFGLFGNNREESSGDGNVPVAPDETESPPLAPAPPLIPDIPINGGDSGSQETIFDPDGSKFPTTPGQKHQEPNDKINNHHFDLHNIGELFQDIDGMQVPDEIWLPDMDQMNN